MMATYTELDWHNLYGESWKGLIADKSFAHPAKFSRKLIAKIYQHCFECGYLKQGDKVLDPFGGVALGALEALRRGCEWYGVELEQKFVNLGNENLALWQKKYGKSFAKWGRAYLLQGDSRFLIEVLSDAVWHLEDGTLIANPFTVGIASPPFTTNNPKQGGTQGAGTYSGTDLSQGINRVKDDYAEYESGANLATLPTGSIDVGIASPPFSQPETRDRTSVQQGRVSEFMQRAYTVDKQGSNSANLSAMPLDAFDIEIASPPFMDNNVNIGAVGDTLAQRQQIHNSHSREQAYGASKGQLGNLPSGEIDIAISSPAYGDARIGTTSGAANVGTGENYGESEGQLGSLNATINSPLYEATRLNDNQRKARDPNYKLSGVEYIEGANYGQTQNQMGQTEGETFWSAAWLIVQQVHQLLKPQGIAVWVVKDYVKDKKRVPFANQWRQLCEACGFETLTKVRAWVIEYDGKQLAHEGNPDQELKKSRKSFLRREVETKAAWRNYWATLEPLVQETFLTVARNDLAARYNALTTAEKTELTDDGVLANPPPTPQRIKLTAQQNIFEWHSQRLEDWNNDVRIDYEVVWFMQKV